MPLESRPAAAVVPLDVLDALPDGVYLVDRERRVTYWNAAAGELSGYGADEVAGRWCGDGLLNHVDEAGRSLCGSRCPLRATFEDGQVHEVRMLLHHRQGHLLPVAVRAAPVRDADGTIVAAVETFRDDSPWQEEHSRARLLEVAANQDPLTGIGNRRSMEAHLRTRLAALVQRGVPLGLLMADADAFKALNDTYGHAVGDHALRVMAGTLQHCLPARGRVFRYGGEEFVAVVGGDDLATVGSRLCAYVEESRIEVPDGRPTHVTVSIGATRATRDDTVDYLLRRADQALYAAKRAGGNCVVTDSGRVAAPAL